MAKLGVLVLNGGVRRALEEKLGIRISVSPLCQLNGAYGAAIHGWKKTREVSA